MQTIDSGFCRTSNAAGQASATQGFNGFHGSPQERADRLVRDTVLADLGQSVGQGRHGHGVQAVAAAVAKVLSGQDVTGTDAADDVLKKIETSLHKAAQKLADRGVDAKTIDATIDKFRDQLAKALDGIISGAGSGSGSGSTGSSSGSGAGGSPGSGVTSGSGGTSGSGTASGSGATSGSGAAGGTDAPTSTPAPASSTTSVSTFVAREVRKERGAIDLVTAEGDRVSIRFRTKEVVTASGAQATSSDGSTTTATKGSVFSHGGVKIEVDGDLNEDELAAIGDLLGKVDDIATKFFSGDVQAAFSAAGSLGVDSDQIAAYRLNLTYSRKVTSAYGYAGANPPTQTPATGDGTSAGGSTNGPTSGPSTAAGNGTSSTSTGDATSGATDGTSTSGTADTPPTTPASAQKTILNFINDALSTLSTSNGAGRLSFSTHWKMSVVITAIQSVQPAQPTTATDKAAASNTQLLGDSLQKIASA